MRTELEGSEAIPGVSSSGSSSLALFASRRACLASSFCHQLDYKSRRTAASRTRRFSSASSASTRSLYGKVLGTPGSTLFSA